MGANGRRENDKQSHIENTIVSSAVAARNVLPTIGDEEQKE